LKPSDPAGAFNTREGAEYNTIEKLLYNYPDESSIHDVLSFVICSCDDSGPKKEREYHPVKLQ
jgi:hypothetical protein